MAVHESDEVIGTIAETLVNCYREACRRLPGRKPYRDTFTEMMVWLGDDPYRALRVGFYLGAQVVEHVRPILDLSDPEAGLAFHEGMGEPPEEGEAALQRFLNHLLHDEPEGANVVFAMMAADDDGPCQVKAFLGLLVALVAYRPPVSR